MVNEALEKFSAAHAIQAEVVKLRYFVGMTNVDRGRDGVFVSTPPSKPDRPVSGIRLSSQWVLLRDWIACARAMAKENSPSSAK